MAEGALRTPTPAPPETLPYARHQVGPSDVEAVVRALGSDRLAQGPECARFERGIARAAGTPHAVAVSSGTAALQVALAALGVGPGDEVIVPPLTFVATANAVALCGARPVFADVDPETLCLAPAEVARRVGPRTRGAIPVHFAGHPADVPGLREALGGGRFLLEDACHALGASRGGRPAGALGDVACFSFHPAKAVTSGEGGAVTTASNALAARARRLREHGIERHPAHFEGLGLPARLAAEERGEWVYELGEIASNSRLPEASAALGASQLERLPLFLARRRVLALRYREALAGWPELRLPEEGEGAVSAWHLFPVRLAVERLRGGRAAVFRGLRARGIGVQVHYVPVHLQPYYRRRLGTAFGDLPAAEDAYLRLLSLPLFPAMRDADVARTVEALADVLRELRR